MKTAALLVRNTATHDARVMRAAATLREIGYRPMVVAVTSAEEGDRETMRDGTPILRLTPTTPLGGVRRRFRRLSESPDPTVPRAPAAPARRRWRLLLRGHRLLRTLDYYRRGIAAMRAWSPDLVHCNDYNTMWIGVGARLLSGSALIYDAHELWPDRNLRPEPRWWLCACEAIFVRVAHRVITTSPGYAEVMARRYRIEPPTVVRNISEAPAAASGGRPERDRTSAPTAVYVGGLTRNRGLEQCIAALARVPGMRMRAIGPGAPAYREELRRLASALGVETRVTIEQPVASDQVPAAIAGAQVGLALIQPSCLSYRLSLPNKLFEYVAAGLPILGSDVPVIASFIRDHAIGEVARAADPDDIAAKLSAIAAPAENDRLREAVAGARKKLSWGRESRLLVAAYEGASSRSR